MALTLAKALRLLAAEKNAVLKRQADLVANLNKLLPSIGYQVVPLESEGRANARLALRVQRRGGPAAARPLGTKPHVCVHCNRTFALPLHLGRHLSVMHRAKSVSTAPSPSAGGRPTAKVAKLSRRSRGQAGRKAAARRRRARAARVAATKVQRKASTARRGKA